MKIKHGPKSHQKYEMSDKGIIKFEHEVNLKDPMLEHGNTGTDLNRPLKAFSRTKSFM